MPRHTYARNPVHHVVNDFPAALVPASVVFDMLHLVTRRGSFKVGAFFTLLMALASGALAAVTGYRDYREIPEGTDAKQIANTHALLNVAVLGSLAAQVFMRITGRVGLVARLLNVAAAAGLAASGWYGTTLVLRHGLGVRGSEEPAGAESPDGTQVANRLEALSRLVPARDLSGIITGAGDDAHDAADNGYQVPDASLDAATSDEPVDPVDVAAVVRQSLAEGQVR